MDQIFRDHLPFIIGGLAFAVSLAAVRRQTSWGKRLSVSLLVLTCFYPCAITYLFMNRMNLGESYAYLIFGDVLRILLAMIAAIIVLAWIPFYVIGVRRKVRE